MKTNQILVLAGLGMGAYFLMTRSAQAAPVSTAGQSAYAKRQGFAPNPTTTGGMQAQQSYQAGGLIAQGLNAVGALVGLLKGVKSAEQAPSMTNEIQNSALPGQTGYGWRYYSDGTAIDPNGAYYSGGQAVWEPQIDNSDSVAVNPVDQYSTGTSWA